MEKFGALNLEINNKERKKFSGISHEDSEQVGILHNVLIWQKGKGEISEDTLEKFKNLTGKSWTKDFVFDVWKKTFAVEWKKEESQEGSEEKSVEDVSEENSKIQKDILNEKIRKTKLELEAIEKDGTSKTTNKAKKEELESHIKRLKFLEKKMGLTDKSSKIVEEKVKELLKLEKAGDVAEGDEEKKKPLEQILEGSLKEKREILAKEYSKLREKHPGMVLANMVGFSSVGKGYEQIKDVEESKRIANFENEYRESLKAYRKELFEKNSESHGDVIEKTVALEAVKLNELKIDYRLNKNSGLEKTKANVGRVVERYTRLPKKYKYGISAALFGAGVLAGVAGGATGAAILTGVFVGRGIQRVFSTLATTVGVETWRKGKQEEVEKSDVVAKLEYFSKDYLVKNSAMMDKMLFDLEGSKTKKKYRRFALAGTAGALVGSGAIGRALGGIFGIGVDAVVDTQEQLDKNILSDDYIKDVKASSEYDSDRTETTKMFEADESARGREQEHLGRKLQGESTYYDSVEDPASEPNADKIDSSITQKEFLNENTLLQKGDGILHVIKRQLLDDPTKYGFSGDVSNSDELKAWANTNSYDIAKDNGIIDKDTGEHTRVNYAKDVHYVLKEGDGGIIVQRVNSAGLEYEHPHGTAPEDAVKETIANTQGNATELGYVKSQDIARENMYRQDSPYKVEKIIPIEVEDIKTEVKILDVENGAVGADINSLERKVVLYDTNGKVSHIFEEDFADMSTEEISEKAKEYITIETHTIEELKEMKLNGELSMNALDDVEKYSSIPDVGESNSIIVPEHLTMHAPFAEIKQQLWNNLDNKGFEREAFENSLSNYKIDALILGGKDKLLFWQQNPDIDLHTRDTIFDINERSGNILSPGIIHENFDLIKGLDNTETQVNLLKILNTTQAGGEVLQSEMQDHISRIDKRLDFSEFSGVESVIENDGTLKMTFQHKDYLSTTHLLIHSNGTIEVDGTTDQNWHIREPIPLTDKSLNEALLFVSTDGDPKKMAEYPPVGMTESGIRGHGVEIGSEESIDTPTTPIVNNEYSSAYDNAQVEQADIFRKVFPDSNFETEKTAMVMNEQLGDKISMGYIGEKLGSVIGNGEDKLFKEAEFVTESDGTLKVMLAHKANAGSVDLLFYPNGTFDIDGYGDRNLDSIPVNQNNLDEAFRFISSGDASGELGHTEEADMEEIARKGIAKTAKGIWNFITPDWLRSKK